MAFRIARRAWVKWIKPQNFSPVMSSQVAQYSGGGGGASSSDSKNYSSKDLTGTPDHLTKAKYSTVAAKPDESQAQSFGINKQN